MAETRYSFDGQMVTPAELSLRVTCYSQRWLGEALRAGCRSVRDLHVYAERGKARQRAAAKRGTRKLRRFWVDDQAARERSRPKD